MAVQSGYLSGRRKLAVVDLWPCPYCGEDIPDALIDGEIDLPERSKKLFATCPNCAIELVREPEADDPHLRSWWPRAQPPEPPGTSVM
jgi:hypothetical protein